MNDKNKSQTSYDNSEMQEFEKTDFSDNADLLSKPSKKNHKIIITAIIMFLVGIAVILGVTVINPPVEVTSNYSLNKFTKTLTILSDDYFYSDYKKFGGSNPSDKVKNVIINNGVTKIDRYAFCDYTHLTNITIPNSVTYIGKSAFYGCTSLTSITIPNSVTEIGEYAFCCTSLTSITIPDSVTHIDKATFCYCTSLTSIIIPDSVTQIGEVAFTYCPNLTSITIPKSVTKIAWNAFWDWTNEQTIYIQGRSSAPDTWEKDWNKDCNAKIVWDA